MAVITTQNKLIENVKDRLGKLAAGLTFEAAKNNYCDIFKDNQALAHFTLDTKLTVGEIEHLAYIIKSELNYPLELRTFRSSNNV